MFHPILNFAKRLITWHQQHGRKNLPWQKNKTPYLVWLSEIMLQQTQVTTVIPYFEKFIQKFPTVHALAQATLDEVLVLWSGLGYYSRAKNLHKTAQIIEKEFHGVFPNDLETLQTLPGIGRSTAGAILSFAFAKPAPILDGNVKRIFIRLHGMNVSVDDIKAQKNLWEIAEHYLSKEDIADYTQGLMDLGATLCTRTKPPCSSCPFQKDCIAYQTHQTENLPVKLKKKKLPIKKIYFLVLKDQHEKILLIKRPPVGIWSHLWSLPEAKNLNQLNSVLSDYSLELISKKMLSPFRHTFSHFHLDITPLLIQVKNHSMIMESDHAVWIQKNQLDKFGLPKPVKILLEKH